MNLSQYIEIVDKRFKSGISREHSYRPDLEGLIRELVPGVDITNEPANVTDCGNPDYVITKGKIPIGFIEAKDVGKDLNGSSYKEQFNRYRKALDNLIITDYLWFLFYQNGELVAEIRIGEINIDGTAVRAATENFEQFTNLLQNFCTFISQTIKSPKKLAEMMAAKARLLENILEKAITSDEQSADNTAIKQQYETFKNILIHDLTPQGFADIYAQTLAYGMFAARLHDDTLEDFSRQEAAELIPKSNPFLRKLFSHVAGVDIDERIKTTVDNLAEVFRATNVDELLKNFGKSTQTQDPIIHFYETFLAAYDPKLRKARGVWYTPEPVVNFIVRGVDEILKTEFGLKDGLADTSKTTIKVKTDQPDKRTKGGYVEIDKDVHKIQVLDPATGTGTFLAEVVKFIYNNKFSAMQGAWSGYVEDHLIPRLNGFELLMASYSMAHLKLDMLLTETGYKPTKDQRFNIFLTNSLEEHHPDTNTLFSTWLSTEANEANNVKRDTPVMVVMGNPPYAVSSTNKSEWIQNLLIDYKKDLNEKKINLDDDYIKFIRYGQYLIDKNGGGVLAYISNNSFIDGITHRQMRKSLLEGFDKIYVLDLHGNSKKKEISPDGTRDENVFDITQGVSINIFIKKGCSPELAKVFHYDVYGVRKNKYDFLISQMLRDIRWGEVGFDHPYYFFVPKNQDSKKQYEFGFSVKDLFINQTSGIETGNDSALARMSCSEVKDFSSELKTLSADELEKKYKYKSKRADQVLSDYNASESTIIKLAYRPFDERFSIYTTNSQGVLWRPRSETLFGMSKDNIGLALGRQTKNQMVSQFFVSNEIIEKKYSEASTQCYCFPLYVYPNIYKNNNSGLKYERFVNLDNDIIGEISNILSLGYFESSSEKRGFSELDIFDYCYSILYSLKFREKYKEFLKIDFPRIPYPKNKETFWALVKLGSELRQIHLLESEVVENFITSYPMEGDDTVTRKIVSKDWELYDTEKQLGRIWINDQQYFDQIPLMAWEFYIGGYQPAQKWLKDRKGRKLSYDDISHYQKIIVALTQTDRIMKEIDKIDFE